MTGNVAMQTPEGTAPGGERPEPHTSETIRSVESAVESVERLAPRLSIISGHIGAMLRSFGSAITGSRSAKAATIERQDVANRLDEIERKLDALADMVYELMPAQHSEDRPKVLA